MVSSQPPDTGDAYTLQYMLYGHTRGVTCLSFSPDGEKLATGGADALVNIWQVRSGRLLHTVAGHTQGVNGLCWTRDSCYVASVSDDKTVRLWDADTGRLVRTSLGIRRTSCASHVIR